MTGKDEGRTWPFGERKGPYNIYKKNPSVANDNGNLFEVDSDDFSDLKDINVAFSFFNITQVCLVFIFFQFREHNQFYYFRMTNNIYCITKISMSPHANLFVLSTFI